MDLTLHTDKYQINMMYSHWKRNTQHNVRVFDAYFRKLPFGNGFAVFAGLERIVNYINNLAFSEDDLSYLREQPEDYDETFLQELKNFTFKGNISAVPEGTLVFPHEPIIRVEATIFEAHLIETALLNFMNYQTLIATKAARIKQVAPAETLFEFGTRRAQEADAAIWGARSAYLVGFDGTSNLLAGKRFGIPTVGTHAHAWIMDFEDELEAFRAYADVHPENTVLLVDTYDTLRSGVPHAIQIAKELDNKGFKLKGIRLDSGDLAHLSIKARKMLDEAGLKDVKILASSDLDEHVIFELKMQGAKIDAWGIGTQLITAADNPSLGGVYKLVAKKQNNQYRSVIKISENPEKIPTPGFKEVYRIYNGQTNELEGDYIALYNEEVQSQEKLFMFDPKDTWKSKTLTNFKAKKLLRSIFTNGRQVYHLPTIEDIRHYHKQEMNQMWEETLRKLNPQTYYVDLSEKLWNEKLELLKKHKKD